jgi:hypothetical protein
VIPLGGGAALAAGRQVAKKRQGGRLFPRRAQGRLRELPAHRHPGDSEPPPTAVVALDEDADGMASGFRVHPSRGGADSAFEAVADHPRPAADRAFSDQVGGRAVERKGDVTRLDVESVDVVEDAVPSLGHDRQRPLKRRPPA